MPDPSETVHDHIRRMLADVDAKREEILRLAEAVGLDLELDGNAEDARETAHEKIIRFLESVGNVPQTTAAIRTATGLTRGAISTALYGSPNSVAFQSHESPGHTRKRLWSLRDFQGQTSQPRDLTGTTSVEACRRILLDHGNKPMHILTLAKEALRRGYTGRAKTTGDALEFTTATGFWARLSRDHKTEFEQVTDKTFRLYDSKQRGQHSLFEEMKESSETEE